MSRGNSSSTAFAAPFFAAMSLTMKQSKSLQGLLNSIGHIMSSLTLFLLPSTFRCHLISSHSSTIKPLPTAYLDGFRGVVAFLVFVRHFFRPWQHDLDHGFRHYGLDQDLSHTSLLRLPPFRLLYAGPNVPVFLLVSGYVMSLKPLRLMKGRRWDSMFHSLASSVFRRAVRLFLPPVLSTFVVAVAVQEGFFDYPYTTMPGYPEYTPSHPPFMPSFQARILDWAQFVRGDLTNPFTWKSPQSLYGEHLWTTSLQFRASLVLFLTLLGLSTVPSSRRTTLTGLLWAYCFSMGRWDVGLYLAGMILSDVDVQNYETEARKGSQEELPVHTRLRVNSCLRTLVLHLFWWAMLLLGVYMSCFPRRKTRMGPPGYLWLHAISYDYHVWHAHGATLLTWCLCRSPSWQRLFTTAGLRYLGRLSYSLYIVHEPLLHIFGFRVVELCWRFTGTETTLSYQAGLAMAFAMTTPVLIWLADIFERAVDRPSGKFAKWLETKCSITIDPNK